MVQEFATIAGEVSDLVAEWEVKLSGLNEMQVSQKRNTQHRTVKQIVGHLIDSASNNLHRMIHLQYGESPLSFPNYATDGNNDRWIAIQHYQEESWQVLIRLWKYSNLHLVHVIRHIDPDKLDRKWLASPGVEISLREMVADYPRHLKLHLGEIDELITY